MRGRPLVTSLLAVAACGGQDSNVTLTTIHQLGDVRINVDVYTGHPIWVGLGLDAPNPAQVDYPDCPLLDESFHGAVGQRATRPSFGGNWDDERKCNPVGLTVLGTDPLLDGNVELQDDSTTISATYAASALEPRVAIHPTWEFDPGTNTSFAWSNPPDLANTAQVLVLFRAANGEFSQTVTPVNDEIPIVVPAELPAGDVEIFFELDGFNGVPALECVNASSCTSTFFPNTYTRTAISH